MFIQIPATDSGASGTSVDYPAGTVLLQTRMRYGEIFFQAEDVLTRKDRWQPSERQETYLREDHRLTPEATVRFISTGYGGVSFEVTMVPKPDCGTRLKNCLFSCCTRLKNGLCYCCTCLRNGLCSSCTRLKDCFVACFLGLVHYFGLLWGWIVGLFRR